MAKILSYYHLCPINDETEFLGLSQDADSGTVINTLGKNIIISVKLSNQKQINSWAVQDKLSSKVVYDFNKKTYVGAFGHKWIRCWPSECTDINKIKRIKLSKPIENLISIPNENTIVLYTDGTCESLECAIDSRKAKKDPLLLQNKPIIDPETAQILDPTHFDVTNESILFTYFTQSRKTNDVHLVFFDLNGDTLQIEGPVTKLKLVREDRDTKLVGCTVVDSTVCPQLVTMWSDNRLFLLPLCGSKSLSDNVPGHFVAMINIINMKQSVSILGISRDCIAIYGANATQDGGTLVLYNTQFKVIESKQQFKVYFNNSRLWTIEKFIFLAAGQLLGVASFRVSREQLSDMIGSQRVTDLSTYVDTECINADGELEDMLEFDLAAQIQPSQRYSQTNGNKAVPTPHIAIDTNTPYELVENVENDFKTLQKYELSVEIEEDADLLPGMMQLKLSANAHNGPFSVASITAVANELERIGASEYEITDCMVPLLLKAELDDDLLTCLRTYSNVSEQSLAAALKYFVDAARDKTTKSLTDDDKTVNGLNAVLSGTFNHELILDHLRTKLDTDDTLYVLTHIFAALEADEVQLEQRPQIDNSFGDDEQLIKWLCALIDSHFQEFLISRDTKLINLLEKWKELIDNLVQDIQQTTSVSAALRNLLDGKTIKNESSGSKWYSVEAFKLY